MSKRAKVVVSTPAPWKKAGGCYLSISVGSLPTASAYRPTDKSFWLVVYDGRTVNRLPASATEDDAIKAVRSYLRERLLADLASLHEDEVTGTGPVLVAVQ